MKSKAKLFVVILAQFHRFRGLIFFGTGCCYLNKLIKEKKKEEDRKKRVETIKSEQMTKQQKINHLKTITKVSSTSLAANNHYTLDENVRDLVLEKEAAEQAAKAAIQQKKNLAEVKWAETLKNAQQKFVSRPNDLMVLDMKVLIAAATTYSDLPVKKKKDELREQIYHEPWFGRVQQLTNDLQLTSAATVAKALIALLTPPPVPAVNPTAV